jgi:pimeloyl-ACP methyl ester carboxylesterase
MRSEPVPDNKVFHRGDLTFSALDMGEGPVVLCLHGFPDNLGSFRHQQPAIAEAGYRVISLALRGYEPSSIPADGDYTVESIAADIIGVIDQLGSDKVHLVGHDWGAAVAYTAAAAAPERFESLITMAVPHPGRFAREGLRIPKQLKNSWYMGFFNIPWLSDWVVARQDFAFIRKLWRDWSPCWTSDATALDGVIDDLSQPGVLSATLGYYRAALSLQALTMSADDAHYPVPVATLALTGERDGCIDSRVFERLMHPEDFPRGLKLERVTGAGHFLHQERPELVNDLILKWLANRHALLG